MLNELPKHVDLYLKGRAVGQVELNRFADSWIFGNFAPTREFSEFAPLFGEWSLLLHADDDEDRVSQAALEELRKLEVAIDSLRAELRVPDSGDRLPVDQLNIDGDLVELKLSEKRPIA